MITIETLKVKVFAGAKAKNLVITDEVLDRWAKEFAAIEKLDCTEYIWINSLIADICNRNNWFRTPGFSNEISSMVDYCLDITKINPIDEKLVVECFIHPYFLPLRITVLLAEGRKGCLIDILKTELPDYNFSEWAFQPSENDPTDYEKITIEGSEYCVQAGGVIIAHKSIQFITSRHQVSGRDFYLKKDRKISYAELDKYTYGISENHYLTKFESIINQVDVANHPYNLPLDDALTYRFLLNKDNLKGLHFIHLHAKCGLLSYVKPTSIYDLAATKAVYLSRSSAHINRYIKCKNTYSEPQFESDKRVDALLHETYGALIYAETFVNIAHEIAGIELEDAEIHYKYLRSNRYIEMIDRFYTDFEKGCSENSTLTRQDFNKLVELIKESVVHLFSKTYCLSSSCVSYWSAYYKVHFTAIFDKGFSS